MRDDDRLIYNVSSTKHCPFCCRHPGLVIVSYSHPKYLDVPHTLPHTECDGCYPSYGPCPRCEKGKRLEFPDDGKGPWGKDGYWQGNIMPEGTLPETCDCKAIPVSKEYSIEMSRKLQTTIAEFLDMGGAQRIYDDQRREEAAQRSAERADTAAEPEEEDRALAALQPVARETGPGWGLPDEAGLPAEPVPSDAPSTLL